MLIGAVAVASVGNGLFLPLALVYFLALTDVPLATLGVLLGAASAVSLPIPALTGMLVDRFSARRIVILSQLILASSYVALVWVDEPIGIFVASMLGSVGSRLYWSSIFTLISDYVDGIVAATRTDGWFAWANIARTVGIGVGGLITGLVIADGSDAAFRSVAMAAAACFAAAGVAIAVAVRVTSSRNKQGEERFGYRTLLRDGNFVALTALNVIFALSTLMLAIALPTFARDALGGPAWVTSTLLVGNAVLVLVLGGVIVRVVAPLRRTRVLVAAGCAWTLWCIGFAVIAPEEGMLSGPIVWVVLVAATLLFTVAELMHAPSSMAIAAAIAPPSARGRYLATFQYSWVIAEIMAPVLFATLFAADHALPFVVLAAVNLVGVAVTLLLERRLPASVQHG